MELKPIETEELIRIIQLAYKKGFNIFMNEDSNWICLHNEDRKIIININTQIRKFLIKKMEKIGQRKRIVGNYIIIRFIEKYFI